MERPMPLWKRLGSIVVGGFLLVSVAGTLTEFRAAQQWLILLAIPVGLGGMWALARYEKLAFGAWSDYLWGCLLGVVFVLLIHALATGAKGASLGEAIGQGFATGAFIGVGLGLLVSGVRG